MADAVTLPDGPKRIQRRRTKGWRMPEGAIYVGRPTKWGNPAKVGDAFAVQNAQGNWCGHLMTASDAFEWYRVNITTGSEMAREAQSELRGKDLVCWCSLDQPCHADVLLELANV